MHVNISETLITAKHLKVKDFRMADEQQMIDLLGVERGCATPMALMNDKDKSGNASKVSKPG